jgi:ATP-binding cassette subfamily F protein uup
LDNVATSILAFEGDGVVTSHIGGYSDYISSQQQPQSLTNAGGRILQESDSWSSQSPMQSREEGSSAKKKLTYKYKHELEKLPAKIEKLGIKIYELSEELSATEDRNSANLAHIAMEIAKNQKELDAAESRWLELEEMSSE